MIIEARKNAHFTQSELATKVGISQSVISRIESGNSAFIPSLETLARIADTTTVRQKLSHQILTDSNTRR